MLDYFLMSPLKGGRGVSFTGDAIKFLSTYPQVSGSLVFCFTWLICVLLASHQVFYFLSFFFSWTYPQIPYPEELRFFMDVVDIQGVHCVNQWLGWLLIFFRYLYNTNILDFWVLFFMWCVVSSHSPKSEKQSLEVCYYVGKTHVLLA